MEYEVEGPRPRGRPKRTWRDVVREDCQARKLNKEDAMDRCKWRKMIKDVWWSGWVWLGERFFSYWPTRVVPDKRPLNSCVCVCGQNVSWKLLEIASADLSDTLLAGQLWLLHGVRLCVQARWIICLKWHSTWSDPLKKSSRRPTVLPRRGAKQSIRLH